jgi:regulator of protease activity HflC (stomatin/prohibitin superfamily)
MAIALVIGLIVAALLVLLLATGMRVLQDFEQGIHIRLGRFRSIKKGGFHWIVPFIDRLIKIDTRTQVLEVPPQDVITKDNAPVRVDGIIISRISDAHKTFYQVGDHVEAITALAQTSLRSIVGDMDLDETLNGRERINAELRRAIEKQTSEWGVLIENVEIKEVEPSANVKQSMERQSSAERNRRAAILEAEATKQSNILTAQGEREANILRASGEKEAQLLRAEGEAGSLHLLSLGASLMDDRAMALRGLDTLKAVGNSPSTKFVVPMELTKALQGVAKAFGGEEPASSGGSAPRMKTEELERHTGLSVRKIFQGRRVDEAEKLARQAARDAERLESSTDADFELAVEPEPGAAPARKPKRKPGKAKA